MIEAASGSQNILCVTYDSFDLPEGFRLTDVSWAYHASQVAGLIVVGILAALLDDEEASGRLRAEDKADLVRYVERFIGSMTSRWP
jgi:hypothetical protein